MTKLAAIYNCWDGVELLDKSIELIYEHVDLIIIVYQDTSNRGEIWSPMPEIKFLLGLSKVIFVQYEPDFAESATLNEKRKRNLGLHFAKINHATHFLHIDNDEMYEDFGSCKEAYFKSGHLGSVCKMRTYFKKPTLMFNEVEGYYVPFIHQLKPDTKSGSGDYLSYPFYVDPTRTINETDVVELPIFMHHFSWVRKDIMRKIRNSSAPIQQNTIAMEDYQNAEHGYFLKNWQIPLITVEDRFNLSHIFE